jgi:hypothetical protein
LESKDAKIWRPRQVYVGPSVRSYIPLELREEETDFDVTNFTVSVWKNNVLSFSFIFS